MALTTIQAIDLARKNIQEVSANIGILNTFGIQELLDYIDKIPNQPASLMLLFDTLASTYNNIKMSELFSYEQIAELRADLQAIRLTIVNYLAEKI